MKKYILYAGLLFLIPTFVIGDFINRDLATIFKVIGAILITVGLFYNRKRRRT